VGGLAFHRLIFARRRSGWWTPLVTGILGLAIYLGLLVVVMVVIGIALFRDPARLDDLARLGQSGGVDMGDPLMVAILLGTIALMLPAYILASLIVNGRGSGSSPRPRDGCAGAGCCCAALAVGVSAVLTVVGLLLPAHGGARTGGPAPTWPITLVVVLLLVPVQAAAEEYIFRGYLMQSIGRWLRHPAFAILLPVPLFVLGHGYDLLGQIGVGLFAVAAGWLTWRTGGLEAAIALHVVNNLSAFLLSLASGSSPTESTTGLVSFLWSFLLIAGYVALVEWMLARRPLPRTLVLPPPAPVW
jgi:membrane protease YdiL (CAAX protease family)